MPLYTLGDDSPQDDGVIFVAPNAAVIGKVHLGIDTSVWWSATIRGDTELISVGPETNVQDGAVLHADPGQPTTLGRGVTVGHGATLHGCTVGDYALIGIGATVLNGARIGPRCVIGAHALVPEKAEIPEGSLVLGVPAKVKKALSEEQQAQLEWSARHYVENARRYASGLQPLPAAP